jgi:hypothetical protein
MPGGIATVTHIASPRIVATSASVQPPPVAKYEREEKPGYDRRGFIKKRIDTEWFHGSKIVGTRTGGNIEMSVEAVLSEVDTDATPFSNHVGTRSKNLVCNSSDRHRL